MAGASITYLSEPQAVSMADPWYDIAQSDHFWVRRRFDVMKSLMQERDVSSLSIAEVGCGHGLVQNQVESYWGNTVDGFDLNAGALRSSWATRHPLYCYDIFDRNPEFERRYDLIILFDVLEHAENDAEFLSAALFHLSDGGSVLINVPALPSLHSRYDVAAGHYRRYNRDDVRRLARSCHLKLDVETYWGFWLVPLVALRKYLLKGEQSEQKIISKGFEPPSRFFNEALYMMCRLELLPQVLLGSSLMVSLSRRH